MKREIRTKEIKIRLHDREFEEFKNRASGRQVASYIRDLVLEQKVVKHAPSCDPKLIFEVAKIGANLNQIARVLNFASKSGENFDVLRCIFELNTIKESLDQVIENQTKVKEDF
jgi:hypothetical protein